MAAVEWTGYGVLSRSGAALRTGFALADLDVAALWLAQYGLGGNMTHEQVRGPLVGGAEVGRHEHDLLATALNERLADLGMAAAVPCSAELGDPAPLL